MELFRRYTTTTTTPDEYTGVVINGNKQGTHYNIENKRICYYLNNKLIKSTRYLDNTIYALWYNMIYEKCCIFWYNSRFLEYISIYKGNKFHGLRFYWNIHGEFIRYI